MEKPKVIFVYLRSVMKFFAIIASIDWNFINNIRIHASSQLRTPCVHTENKYIRILQLNLKLINNATTDNLNLLHLCESGPGLGIQLLKDLMSTF